MENNKQITRMGILKLNYNVKKNMFLLRDEKRPVQLEGYTQYALKTFRKFTENDLK